jgi:hypothetical protein
VSEDLLDSAFFKAAHTPFEVRRRLVLSLILPHVNYGDMCLLPYRRRRLGVAFKGLFALHTYEETA